MAKQPESKRVNLKLPYLLWKRATVAAAKCEPKQTLNEYISNAVTRRVREDWRTV